MFTIGRSSNDMMRNLSKNELFVNSMITFLFAVQAVSFG